LAFQFQDSWGITSKFLQKKGIPFHVPFFSRVTFHELFFAGTTSAKPLLGPQLWSIDAQLDLLGLHQNASQISKIQRQRIKVQALSHPSLVYLVPRAFPQPSLMRCYKGHWNEVCLKIIVNHFWD
jgi:hypothetical protein